MAVRTFFGSCATLTSSIANLTLLMVLDGEPAWICFLSCNAESTSKIHHSVPRKRKQEKKKLKAPQKHPKDKTREPENSENRRISTKEKEKKKG